MLIISYSNPILPNVVTRCELPTLWFNKWSQPSYQPDVCPENPVSFERVLSRSTELPDIAALVRKALCFVRAFLRGT